MATPIRVLILGDKPPDAEPMQCAAPDPNRTTGPPGLTGCVAKSLRR